MAAFPATSVALWDGTPVGESVALRVATLDVAVTPAALGDLRSLLQAPSGALCLTGHWDSASATLNLQHCAKSDAGLARVTVPLDPPDLPWAPAGQSVSSLAVAMDAIHAQCCAISSSAADLCFASVRASRRHTLDGAVQLAFEALLPACALTATPIRAPSIANSAHSRRLMTKPYASPDSGFLSLDETRKALFIINSDTAAIKERPLVGAWVAGVTSVTEPAVWFAALKFMHCSLIQTRRCMPPMAFLLAVFTKTSSTPLFFECAAAAEAQSPPFSLLTGSLSFSMGASPSGALVATLSPVDPASSAADQLSQALVAAAHAPSAPPYDHRLYESEDGDDMVPQKPRHLAPSSAPAPPHQPSPLDDSLTLTLYVPEPAPAADPAALLAHNDALQAEIAALKLQLEALKLASSSAAPAVVSTPIRQVVKTGVNDPATPFLSPPRSASPPHEQHQHQHQHQQQALSPLIEAVVSPPLVLSSVEPLALDDSGARYPELAAARHLAPGPALALPGRFCGLDLSVSTTNSSADNSPANSGTVTSARPSVGTRPAPVRAVPAGAAAADLVLSPNAAAAKLFDFNAQPTAPWQPVKVSDAPPKPAAVPVPVPVLLPAMIAHQAAAAAPAPAPVSRHRASSPLVARAPRASTAKSSGSPSTKQRAFGQALADMSNTPRLTAAAKSGTTATAAAVATAAAALTGAVDFSFLAHPIVDPPEILELSDKYRPEGTARVAEPSRVLTSDHDISMLAAHGMGATGMFLSLAEHGAAAPVAAPAPVAATPARSSDAVFLNVAQFKGQEKWISP